jgi:hypothetical protein
LEQLNHRKMTREFDINGSYRYTSMLKGQIAGRNNSWAIRWHASAFLRDRLTLMPTNSLVRNIGLDGSGVHCSRIDPNPFEVELSERPVPVEPVPVEVNAQVRECLEAYFRRVMRMRLWSAIKRPRPVLKRFFLLRR